MDPDEQPVPYNEFVAVARDEGLIALDVVVVQAPADANGRTAVVQVTARTAQGGFGAVGEASPLSAPAEWHPFLTTLAELRAKARALRELTGLDHAVREELAAPYLAASIAEEMDALPPARLQPRPDEAVRRAAPVPLAPATRAGPAPMAPRTPSSPYAGERDDDGFGDEDDAGDEDTEPDDDGADRDAEMPVPRAAVSPRAVAPARDEPREDFEGIDRDMEAKLLKLAMSIASLEGADISEAEARQKLDDFFVRAFKHPLNRATRIEGQRVVQRLSSDLSSRRAKAKE